jgi:hypothetical protein
MTVNTWIKYQTTHKGVGTFVSVWINETDGLVRRVFDGDHCGPGTSKLINKADILFKNEVFWLTHPMLSGSKFLPELVSIDVDTKTIIQKYYGPNLLDYLHSPEGIPVPNLSEQILEMYTFFTEVGVNKLNGALSNMTVNDGQLIAFDFKWARPAPKANGREIRAIHTWLTKIDPLLVEQLVKMKNA